MKGTEKSEIKRLRYRVMELEAMVAMAEPPLPDKWPITMCLQWMHDQKKFQRKLDKVAERMKAKGGAK